MIKVAFYIESMVMGGAEKVLIDLVNHLDPKKFEITVIAIFKKSVYTDYEFQFSDTFNPNIRYIFLIDNTSVFRYRLFNYLYAHLNKRIIYQLLINEKYDVEIAFYEGLPTEFVAYSSNPNSIKYAWLHTDNHRLYANYSKSVIDSKYEIYNKYDLVIGVSESVSQSFAAYFPNIQVRTIHNILDDVTIWNKASLEKPELAMDRPVYLTVGRLIKIKGYERLLRCFGRLKKEGYIFYLYMLGDGEEKNNLEELIESEHLTECVRLVGTVQNPYCYMASSSYLICSSFAEGYSTVCVEAILCGLPVLSTACAGINEIFGNCSCGIICDNSEEAIYRMLKTSLDYPSKRDEYAAECAKRKDYFSADERIKPYEELLVSN